MNKGNFLDQMPRYPGAGSVAGVCAGIAAYFGWDARLVRLAAVLGLIFGLFFPVFLSYCVLWYLLRPEPGLPGQHAGNTTDASTTLDSEALGASFRAMERRLRAIETVVADGEFDLRRELGKL